MEVNKLESREVLFMMFGLPIMVTLIVLLSIGVGHLVTTRSDRPMNLNVSAATPKVEVNVPNAPAPNVHVAAAMPKVEVNVPQAAAPTVNFTPPPATVTVIDKTETKQVPPFIPANEKKVTPPIVPVSVPASNPEPNKTSAVAKPENDINTLYEYAEKYIESYCQKNGLDPSKESQEWAKKWKAGLDQAIADNIDSSEQTYINRIVIAKRDCFDLAATPDKVVEGCRLMLRYRDGQLAWLKAMKDAATAENMKKTIAVLAAGVR